MVKSGGISLSSPSNWVFQPLSSRSSKNTTVLWEKPTVGVWIYSFQSFNNLQMHLISSLDLGDLASDSHFRSKLASFKNISSHSTILLIVFPLPWFRKTCKWQEHTNRLARDAQTELLRQSCSPMDPKKTLRPSPGSENWKSEDKAKCSTDKNNDKKMLRMWCRPCRRMKGHCLPQLQSSGGRELILAKWQVE